jgi:crotonobetainyl-CoA:carnitine CoA-transferase CaiB-like acyl-CoA transferase
LAMATGGDRPIIPGKAIADIFAGLYAALGACAQMYQQECHGFGSYVEVTQFEAGASTLDELLTVGPETSESHEITGSDESGWWASNQQGAWPVADAAALAEDLEQNGAIQRFAGGGDKDIFLRLPVSIDDKRISIRRRSPRLGEHTDEVVTEWSDDHLRR